MNRVPVPPSDRGSVVPLLAIVLVGFALSVVVIVATSRHAARVARAQWAADAAALAVAAAGPESGGITAGREVAEANGARMIGVSTAWPSPAEQRMVRYSRTGTNGVSLLSTGMGPVVVVLVDYGGVEAESAAQRFTARIPWSDS